MKKLFITRSEKGLSQVDLCKLSGVSPSRISLYENDHIDLSDKEKNHIAVALGIDPKQLFGGVRPQRAFQSVISDKKLTPVEKRKLDAEVQLGIAKIELAAKVQAERLRALGRAQAEKFNNSRDKVF